MTSALALLTVLFSVLMPQKMWFAPPQPLTFTIKSDKDVTLELTDFSGKPISAKASADVAAGQSVDVKTVFPDTAAAGTYILYALPKGSALPQAGPPKDFLGTPVVIETLADKNQGTVMVTHVEPLQYVVMTTDAGPITSVFYYDVAPHTVDNFLQLAAEGYYDGTIFHRVVPDFVIQGGDPTGTGTGGPGYTINSEFNDRPHIEGVLSMARSNDPNSASSQFFICLDYHNTQQLDHNYTAFGKVTDGMDAVKTIGAEKIADASTGKPEHPATITKMEVFPVSAKNDPYSAIMNTPSDAPKP